MLNLIDSHVHLDSESYQADLAAVIQRAQAAEVAGFISIGASSGFESTERAQKLADSYPCVWYSAGIHPHDGNLPLDIERVKLMAQHPKCVAIGETGLDYFYDHATKENQEHWFRAQIKLALELRKPIIIHCRQAADDCLRILQEEKASQVGGVFHCYSESAEFAAELAKINFMVSFPGILTFKKSQQIRDAARVIPTEQILLETDGPFLAPEPHRGKRCESAHMVETAKVLAGLKGVSLEELARITVSNTKRLFKMQ